MSFRLSSDFKCSYNSTGAIPGEQCSTFRAIVRALGMYPAMKCQTRVQLPRSDVIQVEQDIGSPSQ